MIDWIWWVEYIYALKGRDGRPRYVGRSVEPYERFRKHRHFNTPVGAWVRETDPAIEILEVVPHLRGSVVLPGESTSERERHWIEKFRAEGCDMFNVWPQDRKAA